MWLCRSGCCPSRPRCILSECHRRIVGRADRLKGPRRGVWPRRRGLLPQHATVSSVRTPTGEGGAASADRFEGPRGRRGLELSPQQATVSSVRMQVREKPALIALNVPDGGLDWPRSCRPSRRRCCSLYETGVLAARADRLDKGPGRRRGLLKQFQPQQTTVLGRMPQAVAARTHRLEGPRRRRGLAVFVPAPAVTMSSARMPQVCALPELIVLNEGGEDWP